MNVRLTPTAKPVLLMAGLLLAPLAPAAWVAPAGQVDVVNLDSRGSILLQADNDLTTWGSRLRAGADSDSHLILNAGGDMRLLGVNNEDYYYYYHHQRRSFGRSRTTIIENRNVKLVETQLAAGGHVVVNVGHDGVRDSGRVILEGTRIDAGQDLMMYAGDRNQGQVLPFAFIGRLYSSTHKHSLHKEVQRWPGRYGLNLPVRCITSRHGGDRQEEIYLDDTDRKTFLDILGDVCDRFNWEVHAYCLMSHHYHLLVETPDANLALGMRQLNGVYTQRTNRRHSRVGHVFQGRYTAIIVQKESYLLELARYIVLNPVRARMIRSAQDWPWGSYRATAGQVTRPGWLTTDWILAAFGIRKAAAMRAYRTFVSEGKNQPSPWAGLSNQIYLGDEAFVEKLQRELESDQGLSEIPRAQRRPVPKSLSDYEQQAGSRDEAMRLAYASGGYSMKEIGEYFGLHYSRISRILKAGRAKGKT